MLKIHPATKADSYSLSTAFKYFPNSSTAKHKHKQKTKEDQKVPNIHLISFERYD